ncbi:hypothetical protein C8R47DRAFT_433213 [Mycena vitilis]|nr:hypothetical protein C8R47DRAFT_433213 [Mycena vitilis]
MHPSARKNQVENGVQQQRSQQGGIPARPSREHVRAAFEHIIKLKNDYSPERIRQRVPAIDIPAEQRMEYNTILEQLHEACTDLDPKLPFLFAITRNEDLIRRLVVIAQTAIYHWEMVSSCSSCKLLVTLDTLRTMLQQVHRTNEIMARAVPTDLRI